MTPQPPENRYHRQMMIDGWNQSSLTCATLLVVGSGLLAQLCSLMAAAMGFGRLILIGNRPVVAADRRFLLREASMGMPVVEAWRMSLQAVNPEVRMYSASPGLLPALCAKSQAQTIVMAASRSAEEMAAAMDLARLHGMPLIAAAAGPSVGLLATGDQTCREWGAFSRVSADPILCQVLAALAIERARQLCLPIPHHAEDGGNRVLVSVDALHQRAGGRVGPAFPPDPRPRWAMVGAGALGTWAGIALGLARTKADLTVFDPDVVSETNLNRQVLFGRARHRPKAVALAEALSNGFPELSVAGRIEAIAEKNLQEAFQADLVISCPDMLATRARLNRGVVHYRKALVNGGTSVFGADVTAYAPGLSPCLECGMRIETSAAAVSDMEVQARCAGVSEPSVVTTSALAGALMAYEIRATHMRRPAAGLLLYDGLNLGHPLGFRAPRQPCLCHRKGE